MSSKQQNEPPKEIQLFVTQTEYDLIYSKMNLEQLQLLTGIQSITIVEPIPEELPEEQIK